MNTKQSFGLIRSSIPSDAGETRIIPFVLSTPHRDRHKTILNQNGWELKNYQLNPIVSYQHDIYGSVLQPPNPDNIIGKAEKVRVEKVNGLLSLVANIHFETGDFNSIAEKIFRKVLFGSLSRTSVSFLEKGHGWYGTGNEAKYAENETYYYEGQELIECAIVNIPSDAYAGKRSFSDLKNQTPAAYQFAIKKLEDFLPKKQLDNLRLDDIDLLFEAKYLGIKPRDTSSGEINKVLNEACRIRARRLLSIK